MAAHRYWRVFFPAYGTVGEIEFRSAVGGINLIGSGFAFASSEYSTSFSAAKAIDGNPATDWSPSGNSAWWAYDFGNDQNIAEIMIRTATNGDPGPSIFYPGWSDDGVVWTTIDRCVAVPWTAGNQTQTFAIRAPAVDVPSSGTTFDPATVGPATTLSGGNLIATSTSAIVSGATATHSRSAGKLYFELMQTPSGANNFAGLAVPGTSDSDFDVSLAAIGVFENGSGYLDGFRLYPLTSGISGTGPLCVAVDFDTWRLWVKVGAVADWNSSGSGADPTVPSTGLDIGMFRGTGLVPRIVTSSSGTAITANFGASSFSGAVPAGYTAWDAVAVVGGTRRAQAVIMA